MTLINKLISRSSDLCGYPTVNVVVNGDPIVNVWGYCHPTCPCGQGLTTPSLLLYSAPL